VLVDQVKVRSAILDGEMVGLDENDLPCFEDLQNRRECFVLYFAFDLLMLNAKGSSESAFE
jgi:ATP-dependent DNA ligase